MGELSQKKLPSRLLSEAERQYVYESVQDDVRVDGRRCLDFREAVLRCDLLCYATASAQVSLGETEVLVSVREEAQPSDATAADYPVHVWADCGCLGNGPEQQQLAEDTQSFLSGLYRCLRTPSPMFVDVLLLGYDGNLLDAASLAACVALRRAMPAELAARVPLFATVHQIGGQRLVDATQLEEACSMTRLAVGTDPLGRLVACQTCGGGSLQLETLAEMVDTGVRLARRTHGVIARALAGLPS